MNPKVPWPFWRLKRDLVEVKESPLFLPKGGFSNPIEIIPTSGKGLRRIREIYWEGTDVTTGKNVPIILTQKVRSSKNYGGMTVTFHNLSTSEDATVEIYAIQDANVGFVDVEEWGDTDPLLSESMEK